MTAGQRLQRLETCDVSTMTTGAATAALRDIAVVRGTADQLEGAIARRIAKLNAEGKALPASDALGRNGRTSRRTAERAERRATTLGHTPLLNKALGKGIIGSEHADALAAVAGRLDDDQRTELFKLDRELTEQAASQTPEGFRRKLSKIVDSITDDDGEDRVAKQAAAATYSSGINETTGMHWFRGELTPEQGNLVRRRIDAEANSLAKLAEHSGKRRDQLQALAYVSLTTATRTSADVSRSSHRTSPRADIVVIIDYDKLVSKIPVDGLSEYSDGSPLPAVTARRYACKANIIPVVLGGEGVPLDVGRANRLARPGQRAALRAMYRTCAIKGCDKHFDRCDIHHIKEWEALGLTDLINLLPLCDFHHHRAHEGRWRLQLDPSTRQLSVHLPNGIVHSQSFPDIIEEQRKAA